VKVHPPTIEEIRAAQAVLRNVAARTPVVPLDGLDERAGILLKLEILQPIGSFKIRGVFHAVSRVDEDRRRAGVSTVSAGNTAQALAWTARRLGIAARSLMPEDAPATKIETVRFLGGEPVLVPRDEVFRYMREHGWEREPFAFIHPWTNRDVMIGHGTMGLEIVGDVPDVESVYVPVGGGGLIAGVGSAVKALRPSARIIAVEPEGCPSLHESLRRGRPVSVECDTICDGVAVPYITDEMFPLLRDLVDETVLVPEREVEAMVRRLALGAKIVTEPSGALAAAAAVATHDPDAGPAVAIASGGSIDDAKLAAILRGGSD
jgi:threonine dehydratase